MEHSEDAPQTSSRATLAKRTAACVTGWLAASAYLADLLSNDVRALIALVIVDVVFLLTAVWWVLRRPSTQ